MIREKTKIRRVKVMVVTIPAVAKKLGWDVGQEVQMDIGVDRIIISKNMKTATIYYPEKTKVITEEEKEYEFLPQS